MWLTIHLDIATSWRMVGREIPLSWEILESSLILGSLFHQTGGQQHSGSLLRSPT